MYIHIYRDIEQWRDNNCWGWVWYRTIQYCTVQQEYQFELDIGVGFSMVDYCTILKFINWSLIMVLGVGKMDYCSVNKNYQLKLVNGIWDCKMGYCTVHKELYCTISKFINWSWSMVLGIAKWATALYINNYTVLYQNSSIVAGQWCWGLQNGVLHYT